VSDEAPHVEDATFEAARDPAAPEPGSGPLALDIYQIVPDELMAGNRTDGTGWDYQWADLRRDWMERTSNKFAYRCLPLTIANQLGLWVLNPVGFTARWRGVPDTVDFAFDAAADLWRHSITNHFAYGIVTWNTPFLLRTRPPGSRILVMAPPNGGLKENCHALTGLLESDWMTMSFTMNWKILRPGVEVRFERGEPLFQAIPLVRNPCADLEAARVTYRRLDDAPEIAAAYRTWVQSREVFHKKQAAGEVPQDDWQKHYFRGVTLDGDAAPTQHYTKIRFPAIEVQTGEKPPPPVPGKPAEGPAFRAEAPKPPLRAAAPVARPRSGEQADDEPAPPVSVLHAGGLKLRAWRVHPRGSRIVPAEPTLAGEARAAELAPGSPVGRASGLGWWVFPPCDLDAAWLGGRSFERKMLSPYGDEDAAVVAALGSTRPYDPPKKLAFGDDGDGVLSIWTGLIVQTPPGWALAVRAPANAATTPFLRVVEEVMETDRAPRELTIRLRFLETGRTLELRGTAPWPPLAQLVPMRREAFDEEWLLGQVPLGKAAANAADVYERWMSARGR
jgi:hypothetical protein